MVYTEEGTAAKCKRCKYIHKADPITKHPYDGECHKDPPSSFFPNNGVWPRVDNDDWCGCFQEA